MLTSTINLNVCEDDISIHVISKEEVLLNMSAYMAGVAHLGELIDSDGVYSCDAPDMSDVCEHTTQHDVGNVCDDGVYITALKSPITGDRVLRTRTHTHVHAPRTRTIRVAKDVTVDGIYFKEWYVKKGSL